MEWTPWGRLEEWNGLALLIPKGRKFAVRAVSGSSRRNSRTYVH